jgi:uncharacterized alkaline shock family protein YloU
MTAPAPDQVSSEHTKEATEKTVAQRAGSELVGEHGKTAIADTVVAKIVGMATREMPGVHAMGMGLSRAFGTVRERIPGAKGSAVTQGVAVEVGERQTAVDLDVVVEYGISIPDLASGIRNNVIDAVEKMCGLEVTEVNLTVGDVHLPDDDSESTESRVR